MLDAKMIRADPEKVRRALISRGEDTAQLDRFLALDDDRRKLLTKTESLKAERNRASEDIARMKRASADASAEIDRMRGVGEQIKELDAQVSKVESQVEDILLRMPNVPSDTTPVGKDASDNRIVRTWGHPREFDFEPAPHWDIATTLDIIDFERASKISGSGFILYKGLGARLERALINWMLDLHTSEHGYTEVFPPFLINRRAMTGTGQLPKFEEDMYRFPEDDLFLDPTAEVPVTNIYADEILDGSKLPIYLTAYTACFRREAGAAGKDTRGLLRVHQFDKVELAKFTKPEESYDELEKLTANAEVVLRRLAVPYRVVLLCTADLGFSSAKTYDLEAYSPGVGQWLELSSCSNCEDFQARRANIRFRREPAARPEFVHTLNGSGVALPRTLAAILENYQQKDGTVVVPDVLRPYMGGAEVIG
jgi:seryl-tRNA synthetase